MDDEIKWDVPQSLTRRYKVLKRLGVGGMSTVWQARCLTTNETVAIKIMAPQLAIEDEFRQRFDLEAKLCQQEIHPALVNIYEAGTTEDCPYIVMECLEGKSLYESLCQGEVSVELALRVGKTLATCLAALHDKGIVHRDIKPANVFIEARGDIRLLDMGIARLVDEEGPTKTGMILGSLWYLAPESVRCAKTTSAVDVYALGVTLAEAFANKPLFDRWQERQVQFLGERAKGRLGFQISDTVPREYQPIIAQLTHNLPEERPKTKQELANLWVEKRVVTKNPPKRRQNPVAAMFVLMLIVVCGIILHHRYSYAPKVALESSGNSSDTIVSYRAQLKSYCKNPKSKQLLALLRQQRQLDKKSCIRSILEIHKKYAGRFSFDDGTIEGLERHKNRLLGLFELTIFLNLEKVIETNDLIWQQIYKVNINSCHCLRDYESRLSDVDIDLGSDKINFTKVTELALLKEGERSRQLAAGINELIERQRGKCHRVFILVASRANTQAGKTSKATVLLNSIDNITKQDRFWYAASLCERSEVNRMRQSYNSLRRISEKAFQTEIAWKLRGMEYDYVRNMLYSIHTNRLRVGLELYRRNEWTKRAFLEECKIVRDAHHERDRQQIENWLADQRGFEGYKLEN